ncbi:DNA polymerase family B-domain-containing protein [Polychytrium aggregatum]|uniref:DNA polymerase family B-domain-containing protein n=1 Tax=Polychytrium aggregatum TaxID=110093 RepID=UPI0022FEDE9C|nr:DNA polymerase family B-domain-containing protein [Polychytrium aggregatum]KAI9204886.1 DNA polymerase family B-domain-containing protein [Polychytrium aggregatum]
MDSRRAGRSSNSRKPLSALKELRDAKAGIRRTEQYSSTVSQQDTQIYDMVEEEEFTEKYRLGLVDDDFVVDDDGRGYVDDGRDHWENSSEGDPEDDEDGEEKADEDRKKRKHTRKEKSAPIVQMLAKMGQAAAPKPRAQDPHKQEKDADFLSSLLGDLDNEVLEYPQKRFKAEPSASALAVTPVIPDCYVSTKSAYTSASSSKLGRSHTLASPLVNVKKESFAPSLDDSSAFDSYDNDSMEIDVKAESFDDIADDALAAASAAAFDLNPSSTVKSEPEPEPEPELEPESNSEQMIVKPVAHVKVQALETKTATKLNIIPKFEKPTPTVSVPTSPTLSSSPAAPKKPRNPDLTAWQDVKTAMEATMSLPMGQIGSTASKVDILEPSGTVRMYWFDAYEKNGQVYLFGKALNKKDGRYISCTLIVKNMQRNVFILPRKYFHQNGKDTDVEVEFGDVYNEVDEMRKSLKIAEFRAAGVSRKYAFEVPGIPAEADYMKVVYPYSAPAFTFKSGESFSHVFGSNTNPLELFILKRKLMGPCWIEITNPQISTPTVSWSKVEVTVEDQKHVAVMREGEGEDKAPREIPPLVVMSMSLRTVMNHQKHANEIVALSCLVYNEVNIEDASGTKPQATSFTAIRQLNNMPFPLGFGDLIKKQHCRIECMPNESAILNFLLAMIHRTDPDVIVGHNFVGFDLDVLLHRMKALKTAHWSKIGRLRRTVWPKLQAGAGGTGDTSYAEREVCSGRLMCDTYLAAKDLIRSKSYGLTQLSLSQLKVDRDDIDFDQIPSYFTQADKLMGMIQHCRVDSYLTAELMFKLQILPLTKQLTSLAGNLWGRTMMGARAERNEYLLLHEFRNKKYIVPDKEFKSTKVVFDQLNEGADDDANDEGYTQSSKKGPSRRKPAYAGGLVLEPKKGLYDKFVLLLDFNSLYPSIIQEYNICFTTVQRTYSSEIDQLPEVPDPELERGVLPELIANLVNRRRSVKQSMKDSRLSPIQHAQLDIKQKALKLTANSMYGCLGFSHSRFFAKPLAMLITAKGREILQNTVDLATQEKLDVIYGDTDSVMINTHTDDLTQVKKIGYDFQRMVNKRYRLLEIEMDGFFRRMLLLKKKKYAALTVTEKDGAIFTTLETKGLDLVRRDWCGLSHDASSYVLDQIFSGEGKEEAVENIHRFLRELGENVRQGKIERAKFIINKSLTKNPDDYTDAKIQPHVQVAKRMQQKGMSARVGDTIPYIICVTSEASGGIASKARHPDEIEKDPVENVIDYEWYLSNQIHPPIARLCQPIEETDIRRLADCLGLDAKKYNNVSLTGNSNEADSLHTFESQITDAERFKNVEKWSPRCRSCGECNPWEGVVRTVHTQAEDPSGDSVKYTSPLVCPNASCGKALEIPSLVTQLTIQIRKHISNYQRGWLICDDAACRTKTKQISVYGSRCLMPGCRGTVAFEYTDAALYTQLLYLETLFDVQRFLRQIEESKDGRSELLKSEAYKVGDALVPLHAVVLSYLEKNGRRYVDLGQLFSFCIAIDR